MEVGTVHALRSFVLGRRAQLGLSQAATASRAGVSRKWLSDFESGKLTVELGKVLAVLDALGIVLDASVAGPSGSVHPERDEADLDAILSDYLADGQADRRAVARIAVEVAERDADLLALLAAED